MDTPAAGIPASTAGVSPHNPAVGSSDRPDSCKWVSSSQPFGKTLGFPHCSGKLPLAMASGGQSRCWEVTVPARGPRHGQKCCRMVRWMVPGLFGEDCFTSILLPLLEASFQERGKWREASTSHFSQLRDQRHPCLSPSGWVLQPEDKHFWF